MKANERDDLLIRLDEKSNNTWRSVEKIEKHLAMLNKTCARNAIGVAVNRSGLRRVYWLLGGSVVLAGSIAAIIAAVS